MTTPDQDQPGEPGASPPCYATEFEDYVLGNRSTPVLQQPNARKRQVPVVPDLKMPGEACQSQAQHQVPDAAISVDWRR